jgi:hypothetical protein
MSEIIQTGEEVQMLLSTRRAMKEEKLNGF